LPSTILTFSLNREYYSEPTFWNAAAQVITDLYCSHKSTDTCTRQKMWNTRSLERLIVCSVPFNVSSSATNYGYSDECVSSTASAYECSHQPLTNQRMQDPGMLNLQHYDGSHPAEERMLSALRQNNDQASPTSGLQITTCKRKTKVAAFASDSEKLIMPPRSSFGRYLQHGRLCK
jgi:hypothetical protein